MKYAKKGYKFFTINLYLYKVLTKPYAHLILSILFFFIFRLLFISTVYADCWDWNPGKFLLSEPTESPTISESFDDFQYPQRVRDVAGLLLSEPVYDGNSDTSSESSTDSKSEAASSESEKAPSDNEVEYMTKNADYYQNTTSNINEILRTSVTREIFVLKCLLYIDQHVRLEEWETLDQETDPAAALYASMVEFSSMGPTNKPYNQIIAEKAFQVSMFTYDTLRRNKLTALNEKDVTEKWFEILEAYTKDEPDFVAIFNEILVFLNTHGEYKGD